MTRSLQLGIESNWSLQYSNSFPAVSFLNDASGNPIYQKINEIIVPVTFDKSIIAISVNTTVPVGRIWVYSGYLTRSLTTALGASFTGERRKIFLGKFNLIFFEDLNIDYLVSIKLPDWFISANIAIYQYEGIDTTTIEDNIELIKIAVQA
ncbi:MAG TPA: hypothetical protein VE944_32935 [Nostoc sp.]|uniref:hypothetical protein n=1 Tax=Nostoc sp. TaxID=1180 RepID=UPI002D40FF6D|nr:hypothetical protein [Nostoc sp.]HYX19075.1 hypothetical protein [Nostoc sp.]